jgi:hypothetical protein
MPDIREVLDSNFNATDPVDQHVAGKSRSAVLKAIKSNESTKIKNHLEGLTEQNVLMKYLCNKLAQKDLKHWNKSVNAFIYTIICQKMPCIFFADQIQPCKMEEERY